MKIRDQYMIQFRGLSNGLHLFEFEIKDEFFETFEQSEVEEGDLYLKLEFEKEERMLTLGFNFSGIVKANCDRCLDELEIPMNFTEKLFLKFGTERQEISEDIIVIPDREYEIDISQYIYEYIHLALPFSKVHPDDDNGFTTCNAQMMERMQPGKGSEPTAWDELKKLRDNI